MSRPRIQIRLVNAEQSKYAAQIANLHWMLFPSIQLPPLASKYWWVAYEFGKPIGFAHMCQSTYYPKSGYFARVGVLPGWRGQGLQRRFMKIMENTARREGWEAIYSDTRKAPHSAANIKAAGYVPFSPEVPWGYKGVKYWVKHLD